MTTLTLTPTVIRHLMSIQTITDEFPFLRFAKKNLVDKEKRSCCGKKRRSGTAPAQIFETVKASIAHLPPERIAVIKKALNVDKLTIQVTVKDRVVVYNK